MDSRHFSGSTRKGSRRDCSPLRWPDLNSLFERAGYTGLPRTIYYLLLLQLDSKPQWPGGWLCQADLHILIKSFCV